MGCGKCVGGKGCESCVVGCRVWSVESGVWGGIGCGV